MNVLYSKSLLESEGGHFYQFLPIGFAHSPQQWVLIISLSMGLKEDYLLFEQLGFHFLVITYSLNLFIDSGSIYKWCDTVYINDAILLYVVITQFKSEHFGNLTFHIPFPLFVEKRFWYRKMFLSQILFIFPRIWANVWKT